MGRGGESARVRQADPGLSVLGLGQRQDAKGRHHGAGRGGDSFDELEGLRRQGKEARSFWPTRVAELRPDHDPTAVQGLTCRKAWAVATLVRSVTPPEHLLATYRCSLHDPASPKIHRARRSRTLHWILRWRRWAGGAGAPSDGQGRCGCRFANVIGEIVGVTVGEVVVVGPHRFVGRRPGRP